MEVAEAVYGSSDRVDEAVSWLLTVVSLALGLERIESPTDELLKKLELLHQVSDHHVRGVLAVETLNGLVDIDGYEELRPLSDSLYRAFMDKIKAEEASRQG